MSYVLTRAPGKNIYIDKIAKKVSYQYINRTQKLQILRIANIPQYFFERTILPGHKLVFDAYPDAELEIHTYEIASATLTEKIVCERLAVQQASRTTISHAIYKSWQGR